MIGADQAMSGGAPTAADLGLDPAVYDAAMARWQANEGRGLDPSVLWGEDPATANQINAFSQYAEDEQRKLLAHSPVRYQPLGHPAEPPRTGQDVAWMVAAGAGGLLLLAFLFGRGGAK
jgi:LPXTG-motif cell wall-anchored protein